MSTTGSGKDRGRCSRQNMKVSGNGKTQAERRDVIQKYTKERPCYSNKKHNDE